MADTRTITLKGRRFEPGEVHLVEEVVESCRQLTRQELANTICELLEWRRPNGGLKTSEARQLLEVLEQSGRLQLPVPTARGRPRGSKTSVPHTAAGNSQPELHGVLRDVEPIGLRLVHSPEDRGLWRELVDRYHPQGHRVAFGASLRYLVEVAMPKPAVVACLQLSSPAWKMAARDRWIGWSEQQRRRNLQRIVSNSRFLVLPWIRIPHLASRVLGLTARRFPGDWQRAYEIDPVLLETLVESERSGTCYLAANWISVGQTSGRGRMDGTHKRHGMAPKQVFVYPLVPRATAILRGQSHRPSLMKPMPWLGRGRKIGASVPTRSGWRSASALNFWSRRDERSRRCWLKTEAFVYGRGGATPALEALWCEPPHNGGRSLANDQQ